MIPNEAIILAGGLGTRLKSKVSHIPKPMASIGGAPFLEYLLKYVKVYGIEHVVLSVGYKWEIIKDYFGEEYSGIQISYAPEKEPLGTGGGIRMGMNLIEGDHFYILNGDTFFDINLRDLSEFYFAHKSDIAITVKRKRNFSRYGTVSMDVSIVTGFVEKRPVISGLINGGVYITSKKIFDPFYLPDKFSFETDFLEKYISELKVCAMKCNEYFIDIGVPEDYEKANLELPEYNIG